MKRTLTSFVSLSLFIILSVTLFSSCKKKSDIDPDPDPGTQPPIGNSELSDADSLKYLMYNIMQTTVVNGGRDKTTHFPLYYWYKDIDPNIDPLSPQFKDADELLTYMSSFPKDNMGRNIDRYSFLDDGSVIEEISGTVGDIGLIAYYVQIDANNILPIVAFADNNSPAEQAGVKRGWVITKIDGKSAQYDGPTGSNVNAYINAMLYADQVTYDFSEITVSNGKPVLNPVGTFPLSRAEYSINPVLFDTVYNLNGKLVGYFVFNSFTSATDNKGGATLTKNEIDRVFNKFASNNISSLIIDLRYNGGGDVGTAEYLANKIVPASLKNQLMYQTVFNDLFGPEWEEEGGVTKVYFDGTGNLNLDHVFVIGSRNTASASELTYNNLRPYMDIKLIGDTTYGKPVGQLPWLITTFKNGQESFLAYLIAITFETKNADNIGGYFNGLAPDALAQDAFWLPWGASEDPNLDEVFTYLNTGSFRTMHKITPNALENIYPRVLPRQMIHNGNLPSLRYNGMIKHSQIQKFQKLTLP